MSDRPIYLDNESYLHQRTYLNRHHPGTVYINGTTEADMSFGSKEEQRAWQLAVERSYMVCNLATIGPDGMRKIKKLAEEGNLVAIGFWNEFMAARLTGS